MHPERLHEMPHMMHLSDDSSSDPFWLHNPKLRWTQTSPKVIAIPENRAAQLKMMNGAYFRSLYVDVDFTDALKMIHELQLQPLEARDAWLTIFRFDYFEFRLDWQNGEILAFLRALAGLRAAHFNFLTRRVRVSRISENGPNTALQMFWDVRFNGYGKLLQVRQGCHPIRSPPRECADGSIAGPILF